MLNYSKESYDIGVIVINRFNRFFNRQTRLSEYGNIQAKTFTKMCCYIDMIHDGTFLKDIFNVFNSDSWYDERVLENAEIFKNPIDWEETKSIIKTALCNYFLMFDEGYIPFDKSILVKRCDKFFINTLSKEISVGKRTVCTNSWFLASIEKPMTKKEKLLDINTCKYQDVIELKYPDTWKYLDCLKVQSEDERFYISKYIVILEDWFEKVQIKYPVSASYWLGNCKSITEHYFKWCVDREYSLSYCINLNWQIKSKGEFINYIKDNISRKSFTDENKNELKLSDILNSKMMNGIKSESWESLK